MLNLTLIENDYFITQKVDQVKHENRCQNLYHDGCLLASIFLSNHVNYYIRFRDDSMLIIKDNQYSTIEVKLATKSRKYYLITADRKFKWESHLTMNKVVELVTNLINVELSIEVIEQFFN